MPNREILKYSEEIIKTMSEGLIVISPEGTVLAVNESFQKIVGYSADEIIGNTCEVLDCSVCRKGDRPDGSPWCMLFEMQTVNNKRCMLKRKDGVYVPILKNASMLKDKNGKLIGAIEIVTDITEFDQLDQKVDLLSRQLSEEGGFYDIIGKSPAIKQVFELMSKAAQSDAPIIILGESGSGKELVALAIHKMGRRKEQPFVELNCAALNESLLESELFGHIKGAFTGAHRTRIGRFESVNGGDLFLDEIGDVPLSFQVKLLRVLELNKIQRVGDQRSIDVDFRLITATNKNLKELIDHGEFREDFFYRINDIPIIVPPLRDRKEDIPLLVNSFIKRLRERTNKDITGLDQEVLEFFLAYTWPGNIRELKNALEYAFVIAETGLIQKKHLPRFEKQINAPLIQEPDLPVDNAPPKKTALINALKQAGGNQSQAAKILGVNRGTVWNRMKKFGIDVNKIINT